MTVRHEGTTVGGRVMFAGLPRRSRAGAAVLAGWLLMAAAFAGDLVPTASPGDWLYGVEARRDAHARTLSRLETAVRPPAAPVVAATSPRGPGAN
jgi:hypothetical protein